MTPQRYQHIKTIFHEAASRSGAARLELLERACGTDGELRQEVEKLLASQDDATSEMHAFVSRDDFATIQRAIHNFGDAATASSAGAAVPLNWSREELPQVPGYAIERLIGSGGMGAVYAARQQKPQRTVAIKVMRPGTVSRTALRRFEFEAQVLAYLRHPSIAQVFEAGTFQNHGVELPYFVMEFIPDAVTLTDFAARRQLPLRERLALFVHVCDAIHCGHQKGVIHRDIKPSNLLVDAAGAVKLIDFGVARAVDSDLALTTLQTDAGQLIGTLQYMSPEQVSTNAIEIDIRSDVYALGVVLYQLLTGHLPYEVRDRSILDASRVIQEQPPRKLGDWPETAAWPRGDRRDIELILEKALAKDKTQRYGTTADFGADLRRLLNHEPVLACPPSAIYQMRKFARKNRGLVIAAAAAALALVAGATISSWQAVRATRLQHQAEAERDKAGMIAEFMSDMLKGVGPSVARGRDIVMLKEMMDHAAKRIENRDLAGAPEAELRMRLTIGDAYRHLALFTESAAMLAPALPLARAIHPATSPQLAKALYHVGSLESDRGDLEAAQTNLEEAVAILRELHPSGHRDLAESITMLGGTLLQRGNLEDAIAVLLEALEMVRDAALDDDACTADCLTNLGAAYHASGRYAESKEHYVAARALYERLYPGDYPETANVLLNLGMLLMSQNDSAAAQRCFQDSLDMRQRLYPEGHVDIATGQIALGSFYFGRGEYTQAEALFRDSLATYRRALPGDHEKIATTLNNIAACSFYRGDLADAEALYVESSEMRQRLHPDNVLQLAPTLQNLANLRLARKDLAGAERTTRELIDILRRHAPDGHPSLASALNMRAIILGEAGDPEQAESCYVQAIDLWRRLFPEGDLELAGGLANYAGLLERRGDFAGAESLSREAVALYERLSDKNLWLFGNARLRLGRALTELGRFHEAEQELVEADRVLTSAQGAPAARREDCLKGLVKLYDDWNQADPQPDREQKATQWRTKLLEFAAPQAESLPSQADPDESTTRDPDDSTTRNPAANRPAPARTPR